MFSDGEDFVPLMITFLSDAGNVIGAESKVYPLIGVSRVFCFLNTLKLGGRCNSPSKCYKSLFFNRYDISH